jgi:hypothetical protein
MRKIAMLFCLVLWSVMASAQGGSGGGREPAGGGGREPAGAKSEREGGGGAANRDGRGGEVKEKPGKHSVSPEAVKAAEAIKSANSADGNGGVMTGNQQKEVERQLNDQKTTAAADGRPADARFFEQEKEKLKKN